MEYIYLLNDSLWRKTRARNIYFCKYFISVVPLIFLPKTLTGIKSRYWDQIR